MSITLRLFYLYCLSWKFSLHNSLLLSFHNFWTSFWSTPLNKLLKIRGGSFGGGRIIVVRGGELLKFTLRITEIKNGNSFVFLSPTSNRKGSSEMTGEDSNSTFKFWAGVSSCSITRFFSASFFSAYLMALNERMLNLRRISHVYHWQNLITWDDSGVSFSLFASNVSA